MPRKRQEHELTRNVYSDPNDPRHKAVEIRREYERQGYDVVNGRGVFDPTTGKNIHQGDSRRDRRP